MKVVKIQFMPWDKTYYFDPRELNIKESAKVVVKTKLGMEIGEVVGFEELGEEKLKNFEDELKPIIRLANADDLAKKGENEKQKSEAFNYCKKEIERLNLPMKLVDVHFSFDGGRITFAFISNGRVDFRDLVKFLTSHYQKSIRLQQLGIRDEAKMTGDVGACGRGLCCKGFLKNLESVTSDLAETQQISHRGSERLSGVCGRLRCCLAYEQKSYEELAKNLPPIGSKFKSPKGSGKVIGWHTLKQTVDVRLDDNTVMEMEVK